MEVHLEPELAAKLEQWSAQTGRPPADLVEAAIVGYFNEADHIKATLNSRYDDIERGRVQGISGAEAVRILQERIAARQRSIA